jgi:teichuronic acid biosynthesis protein TuaE
LNPANLFRPDRPDVLFCLLAASAVLGPLLGVQLSEEFRLTLFRALFFPVMAVLLYHWVRRRTPALWEVPPVGRVTLFFAGWFVYAALSLLWAADLGLAVRYLVFLGMMLAYTLCYPAFIRGERSLLHILAVLFAVMAVLVGFGFFESVTFYHVPTSRYWGTSRPAVTSFFQNQNDFASAITLALPFLITALHALPLTRRWRWTVYFLLVFSLYGLLATASRINTFFALPLIVGLWLWALPRTVEKESLRRNFRKGVTVALSVVLIVGLMSTALLHKGGRDKLASVLGIFLDLKSGPLDLDELDAGVQEGEGTGGRSITVRKYLLLYGMRFLHESWYFGVGAGNVEHYMEGQKGIDKVNIHNWWAEVLVNFGVWVFAAYVVFYAWMVIRLWRLASLRHSPGLSPVLRWAALSCFLSLAGFLFGGMAPSTCIHFTPMWSVVGLSVAVVALGERWMKPKRRWENAGQ